jgi:di/tripeptidase
MTEQQAEVQIEAIRAQLEGGQIMQGRLIDIISVSSHNGYGLHELKELMAKQLDRR